MSSERWKEFRAVGRMLWEAGLVSSHGGNMSVRLPDGGLLITRTGAMLGRLDEGDLVTVAGLGGCRGGGAGGDGVAGPSHRPGPRPRLLRPRRRPVASAPVDERPGGE